MGIPEIFNNKTYSPGDVNNRVIFFYESNKENDCHIQKNSRS